MNHMYTYKTRGTCSSVIEVDADEGVIHSVRFVGGCKGNLQAVSKLVEGMKVEDAVSKLSGIRCGTNVTSCPDQLARALSEMAAGK